MELIKGFKPSIFGPIPNDWIEGVFEDFMTGFSSGQTPYRAINEYYKGDIPWITSGELNYNIVYDTIEKISKEGMKAANLKLIPVGTFLFAITGLEAAGTRGSCAITGVEATTNQSCMALYPKPNITITPYIFHFYIKNGNWLAFNFCQGTKQQSYTAGIAKKLPFIAPPTIKEQNAIASALSDADDLINSLEKLIEKKKNIKQGEMQHLLKPKKGWIIKKIQDISHVGRGRVISHKEIATSLHNTYPVYSSQTTSEGIMGYIDTYDFDGEYITWTTDGENAGTVFYRNGKFNCTNVCGTIKLKSENARFISYMLNSVTKFYVSRNLANPKLMNDPMKNIEISIPDIDEQFRISSIIFDFEKEINLLEKKLAKTKLIKQGMMQNLLTGKIRLV
jgi:type I restriction enzyme S subunit